MRCPQIANVRIIYVYEEIMKKKYLYSMLGAIAALPSTMLCGMFIVLLRYFRFTNIFKIIRLNPDIFINQYSGIVVIICLISPFSLVALFLICRLKKKG